MFAPPLSPLVAETKGPTKQGEGEAQRGAALINSILLGKHNVAN